MLQSAMIQCKRATLPTCLEDERLYVIRKEPHYKSNEIIFEVEIIENGKYYNILTPHKKDLKLEIFSGNMTRYKDMVKKETKGRVLCFRLERVSPFKIEESNGQDRVYFNCKDV